MTTEAWHFDPYSAVVTAVVSPVILVVLGILKKSVVQASKFMTDAVIYFVAARFTKAASARLTLRAYCRSQLAGQSRYLHVPSHKNVALEIDKVFVPLVMERTGSREVVDHQSVSSTGNRAQIVGDPGSGKSTVIKRIFRDECSLALNATSRAKFPILLELRNLKIPQSVKSPNLGTWMFDLLKSEANKVRAYRVDTCFEAYAQTSGILILLDGLDEVNTENFERTNSAIRALSEELTYRGPNNVMICTMRVQFYYQIKTTISDIFPVLFSIRPFSPSDVYAFLRQWDFGSTLNVGSECMRIFNDLADRPSLRELCSNPLILSMYVARDQAEGGVSAPESRTDFYMRVVDELVIRRRLGQLGPAQAQAVLKNQRLSILGRIAHNHLVQTTGATNLVPWSEVISAISEVTKSSPEEAQVYLRDLSKETGIISEERERESCRFIHLTFCEFLAAYEVVHGSAGGWVDLMLRHEALLAETTLASRTRLVEVIPFACALLPRYRMPDAVASIERTQDQHTLTMAFLETKIYDRPSWYEFANRRESQLLQSLNTLRQDEDLHQSWLAEVVLFIVVCKDEERARKFLPSTHLIYQVEQFFRKLNVQAKSLILPMIAKYAEHDAVAAVRMAALCQVSLEDEAPEVLIHGCDQPPLVALLVDQAQSDGARVSRIARLLAEAGLRSPAARATLLNAEAWDNVLGRALESGDEERWFSPPNVPPSLLTACITIAVKQHRNAPLHFEACISLIADLPSVSILKKLKFWRTSFLIFGFVFYITGGTIIAVTIGAAGDLFPILRKIQFLFGIPDVSSLSGFLTFTLEVAIGLVFFGGFFFLVSLSKQIHRLMSLYLSILGLRSTGYRGYRNQVAFGDELESKGRLNWFLEGVRSLILPSNNVELATRLFLNARSRRSFKRLRSLGISNRRFVSNDVRLVS